MSKKSDQSTPSKHTTETSPDKPLFSHTDVLQTPNEELYEKIQRFALQFAILGHIETASNLIGKLNKHNWYNGRSHLLRPLYILWDQIGQWPDRELDRVRESIQDERKRAAEQKVKDESGKETRKKVKLEADESPITREDVKKYVDDMYHSYAKCWWYPGRPVNWPCTSEYVPPSPHDRNVEFSDDELKKHLHVLMEAVRNPDQYKGPGTGREPVDSYKTLVSALELRVKLREKGVGDNDGETSENEILEMIAKNLGGEGAYHQIEALAQSRCAWLMLKDGALVKVLGIDQNQLLLFAVQLESVITECLERGKQSPPTLSMKELVETIESNTLTNPDSIEFIKERNLPDDNIPSTILHDPAPASLIEETEKRLDTKLPDDYKEYLGITNGNDEAWGGIINEAPLWRCEDIRWITDDEDYFSDLCIDIPAEMSGIMHEISGDAMDWPKVGRGIIIGGVDIDHTFLIAPPTVKAVQEKVRSILESEDAKVTKEVKDSVRSTVDDFAGSMEEFEKLEWCCITWAAGGAAYQQGFKSFRSYLEKVAEKGAKKEKDLWNLEYRDFFGVLLVGEKSEG